MMQKRTNPLELKVENRAARAEEPKATPAQEVAVEVAPKVEEIATVTKVETVTEPEATTVAAEPQKTAEPANEPEEKIPEVKTAAKKPALSKRPPVAKKAPAETAVVEPEPPVESPAIEYAVERVAPVSNMGGSLQWQMVSSGKKVGAPKPAEPTVETVTEPAKPAPVYTPEVAEPEAPDYERDERALADDILEDELLEDEQETVTEPAIETEGAYDEDDMPEPEGSISDEEEPLVIEDYEMAAHFGLCGRVSRGMKFVKVSKDVCRLAQLMHPNESLAAIIEGALLTRIYLENRDAFDAMVEMLEKKGGHIKC